MNKKIPRRIPRAAGQQEPSLLKVGGFAGAPKVGLLPTEAIVDSLLGFIDSCAETGGHVQSRGTAVLKGLE